MDTRQPPEETIPGVNSRSEAGRFDRRGFLALSVLTSCFGLSSCALFGGGVPTKEEAFAYLRQSLDEVSKNEEQRARLAGLADELDDGLGVLVEDVTGFFRQLGELNADYNAQRSDFTELIERYKPQRKQGRARALDIQERMKAELDEEQWQSVAQALTDGFPAVKRLARST